MDRRREELKNLKKNYARRRMKTVGVWRVLEVLFLLAALAIWIWAALTAFYPELPIVQMMPDVIWEYTAAYPWLVPAAGAGAAALTVLFAVIAGCAGKKLKKSREFLDYRTLKTILKAEKEEI